MTPHKLHLIPAADLPPRPAPDPATLYVVLAEKGPDKIWTQMSDPLPAREASFAVASQWNRGRAARRQPVPAAG